MLIFAAIWYHNSKISDMEPLIVGVGQLATLLSLLFEGQASDIITKGIKNKADVDIRSKRRGNIHTSDVSNSKVKIRDSK